MVSYIREDGMFSDKWTIRFMNLCSVVSSWSKDPSTKVGSVIVDDQKRIISVGYNGFPRGVDDRDSRYEDRPTKYKMVCHAERNALDNAPIPVEGATMFATLMPCSECAKSIIQRGIKKVVVPPWPGRDNYDWDTDIYNWKISDLMFKEAGVELVFFSRRNS
jgi:dCMP deaminase